MATTFTQTGTAVAAGAVPTYSDLRPQIQRNWGRSDTESQATILFYFNVAQRILSRSHVFPELQKSSSFAFVVGTSAYTITSAPISLTNLRKLYDFTYVSSDRGYNLEYTPPREWDLKIAPRIPNATNSYPRSYTKWGSELKVFPPPDSAYTATLRYLSEPTSVTGDSSVLDMVGMNEVLVLLTSAFCFYSVEDIEMGNMYMKQGAGILKLFGIEAEVPKDLHMAIKSGSIASRDSVNDPFVGRL